MDANVNSISSLLPDLSSHAPVTQEKADGPSFSALLKKAEKSETPKAEKKGEVVSKSQDSREAAPVERPRSKAKVAKANEMPVTDVAPLALKKEAPAIDDKEGVIGSSYDGMAVSYPVSQIAKESLDEKTVTNLKDQGLWEIPKMVIAQPSEQLQMMSQVTDSMDESAIPVSRPIAQFMASLENELGVKPDRLVQAFKSLPKGQLTEAPEKTMAQVVKNLKLDPKDETRALELYSKMLSQMESIQRQSMNPALMTAVPATLTSLQGEKLDDKAMTKGKSQLATSRYAQNAMTPSQDKLSPLEKPVAPVPNLTDDSNQFDLKDSSVKDKDATSKEKSSLVAAAPLASAASNSSNVADAASSAPKATPSAQPQVQAQAQAQMQQVTETTHSTLPDAFAVTTVAANKNAITGDEKVVKSSSKDNKDNLNVKGESSTNSNATQIAAQDATASKFEAGTATGIATGGAAAAELKAGNDTKHEAIRSIVNQAQMLAQKGGGEVRMSLKPEHLGEIQLKVAMEGNRVNVQMTTERGEVKKLIEQSVHELRHGLASHNLSMDKLDVSVSNKDTSGFSGKQPDFGAARDFANQFHQQNSRREMMEDLSSLRGNALKSMTSMDRATTAQKAMAARSSTGRLNVVA